MYCIDISNVLSGDTFSVDGVLHRARDNAHINYDEKDSPWVVYDDEDNSFFAEDIDGSIHKFVAQLCKMNGGMEASLLMSYDSDNTNMEFRGIFADSELGITSMIYQFNCLRERLSEGKAISIGSLKNAQEALLSDIPLGMETSITEQMATVKETESGKRTTWVYNPML